MEDVNGIVLLVALTVLLSGVVGVFLFDISDFLGGSQSQVAFDSEYQQVADDDDTLVLRHVGGDAVPAENVRIVITGATYDDGTEPLRYSGNANGALPAGSLSAGGTLRIETDTLDSKGLDDDANVVDVDEDEIDALDLTGATVHVLVVSDDRQSSTLLERWVGPDPGIDDDTGS